jgi:hypothetical protein|tara:strand:+ start:1208 stop:1360 length:153 start_codon:yes stop_codon:yes gene_type:complete
MREDFQAIMDVWAVWKAYAYDLEVQVQLTEALASAMAYMADTYLEDHALR